MHQLSLDSRKRMQNQTKQRKDDNNTYNFHFGYLHSARNVRDKGNCCSRQLTLRNQHGPSGPAITDSVYAGYAAA